MDQRERWAGGLRPLLPPRRFGASPLLRADLAHPGRVEGPLLALAVTAGLLAVAGPASAGTLGGNPGNAADAIVYNGHAGFWLGSNDALGAAIVAADFDYKEARGFIESQYEPTSVEAIDVWETLHGDFSTFPTNLAHRPDGGV